MMDKIGFCVDEIVSTRATGVQYAYVHFKNKVREDSLARAMRTLESDGVRGSEIFGYNFVNGNAPSVSEHLEDHPGFQTLVDHDLANNDFHRWTADGYDPDGLCGYNLLKNRLLAKRARFAGGGSSGGRASTGGEGGMGGSPADEEEDEEPAPRRQTGDGERTSSGDKSSGMDWASLISSAIASAGSAVTSAVRSEREDALNEQRRRERAEAEAREFRASVERERTEAEVRELKAAMERVRAEETGKYEAVLQAKEAAHASTIQAKDEKIQTLEVEARVRAEEGTKYEAMVKTKDAEHAAVIQAKDRQLQALKAEMGSDQNKKDEEVQAMRKKHADELRQAKEADAKEYEVGMKAKDDTHAEAMAARDGAIQRIETARKKIEAEKEAGAKKYEASMKAKDDAHTAAMAAIANKHIEAMAAKNDEVQAMREKLADELRRAKEADAKEYEALLAEYENALVIPGAGRLTIPVAFQQNKPDAATMSDDDAENDDTVMGKHFLVRHAGSTHLQSNAFPDVLLCMSVKLDNFYTTYIRLRKQFSIGEIRRIAQGTAGVTHVKMVPFVMKTIKETRHFWRIAEEMMKGHESFKIYAMFGIGRPFNEII